MRKSFEGQYKNEKVLFFGRENLLRFLLYNTWNIFIFLGLSIFLSFFMYVFFSLFVAIIVFTVFFVVLVASMILIFWYPTFIIVTNKRILKWYKPWIFIKDSDQLIIYSLQECIVNFTWIIDNILNTWNIKFIWKDQNVVIDFRGISLPEEVSSYVSRLRDYIVENQYKDYYDPSYLTEFLPRKERKKRQKWQKQ